jgi:hypothetical protein
VRRIAEGLALLALLGGCVSGASGDRLAPPPPDAPVSLVEEGAAMAAAAGEAVPSGS